MSGSPTPELEVRFRMLLEQARAARDSEYRRGMIAMRLALDLDACRALLRGEQVHPSRLDREYLAQLRRQGVSL